MKPLVLILFFLFVNVMRLNAEKPNAVLFLTDDQGMLDAKCYGSKDLYTPAMDWMAREGVRFTQAYGHAQCSPARAMLLTGQYPQRNGVTTTMLRFADGHADSGHLSDDALTIAEVLKASGWQTGLFGKWHLGAHKTHEPTRQGFDTFFGFRGEHIDKYNHYYLSGRGFHDLYSGRREVFFKNKYFPDLLVERALQFVEQNKTESFFMYVAFNSPHHPEQADPKFDERYKDLPMPRRSYAKMVSTVDDRMGMIIKKLKELDLLSKTILVFTGDNGYSKERNAINTDKHKSKRPKGTNFGANGGGGNTGPWLGYKGQYYEGGIRVPAIVTYPAKLPRGVVRHQAISIMDWFPTILELCGQAVPNVELDGASLLPIIRGAKTPSHHKVMHWEFLDAWAVREGSWKLIGKRETPKALVHLEGARPEGKNHLKSQPAVASRLLQLHFDWLEKVSP